MKAIAREPGDRYPNMLELVEDLKAWIQHDPVKAHVYTPWQRFVNWEQRNVVLTISLGSLLLGSLVTVLLQTFL